MAQSCLFTLPHAWSSLRTEQGAVTAGRALGGHAQDGSPSRDHPPAGLTYSTAGAPHPGPHGARRQLPSSPQEAAPQFPPNVCSEHLESHPTSWFISWRNEGQ